MQRDDPYASLGTPVQAPPAADPYADLGTPAPAGARPAVPAGAMVPTGQLHDGDTFRLSNGQNARLYGADAFELQQTGLGRNGAKIPLGAWAKARAAAFALPGATVTPTGDSTYGRPVASLENNGQDAATALLHDGLAVTTPHYLRSDPSRFLDYTQAERGARLNQRGAFAGKFQTPEDYRHGKPDPWATPTPGHYGDGNSQAVFWDDPTPFQGLKPEVEQGYASVFQDMRSKPDDLLTYAKANGFTVDPDAVRARYAERDKAGKGGAGVEYAKPPRVLTNPGDGRMGATLRGFGDPLNVLDEAGAIADSLVPGGERENVWGSDRRFGDIYANNLEQNRSILDYDETNHPWFRFGGQLASGLVLPGASVEGVGLAAARSAMREGASRFAAEQAARRAVVSRLGTAGAIEGGLAGAGAGEDLESRALGATIGAPAGGVLGVGAGVLAPKLASLVGRPFSKLTGAAGERSADDFASGAVDAGKAIAGNDLTPPPGVPSPEDLAALLRPRNRVTADMAAERNQPAIYGPSFDEAPAGRVPDRIDVTGRGPVGLVPGAERLEAAGGVTSRDMLPLTANTVDGVEEAARIDRGRFDAVRAPNEDAELARRRVASFNTGTPIPQKGPLDLVSFLRSEGGIKAQGGELAHAGIDNAPRKGMDFAGSDSRLGPLVSSEGRTYDDAAYRAWEAGYFPDHAEPPTIPEFLDALTQTHRGQQRTFHPDDWAEVDSFQQARKQRWDVEQARDAGAPLTSDRSQPAGLDDLDANAPPVRAYEEWGENAPNLAGNIRLDKLDSPQAIKRALVQTENVTGGFDAARRGRITQAETKALAEDLGMTADDLLKRRKGEAFNAEQALAARQILARSATDLVNVAKRINNLDNPGDELEAAFREVWLRHAAIQEQVSGMTAEAGRLLQQFRMTADSRDTSRVLSSLGDGLGGTLRLKDVAGHIVKLEAAGTTPAGINKYALRSLLPQWRDKAVELYINSLLSGPQTHAVNILSNTLTSLAQLPEHAVAAGIGAVRKALPGEAETDRVLFSELGARAAGMVSGAREGMRAAARSFLTGDTVDGIAKVEQQQMNAIGGRAGSFIRTPTRLLSAEDEIFKGIASRMELNGLALRLAKSEGLTGKAARERAGDLVLNPTDDLLKRSMDYARYLTFQTPLRHGSAAAGISAATQGTPILKLLLPFVRTPMNLLKFAAERSPAALAMKSWRKEFMAGGAQRDLAMTRVLVGTGVGASIYEMAQAGQVTGGGPADRNARRLMQANGWQPYSLKIGDKYYSYARLDPFSTTIGTVADLVDLQSHMTDKQQERSMTLVAAAIANNLSSKTWLSGLSSALESVNDPDRYMQNFLSRTAGAIAVPSIVAQIARTTDPIMREARGPMDRIRSRIPASPTISTRAAMCSAARWSSRTRSARTSYRRYGPGRDARIPRSTRC